MQVLSPAFVPGARALIQQQGGNPFIFTDGGELNPDGLIQLLFNEVEVSTSATPTLRFPIGPTGAPPNAAADALIKTLQPSIVFSGPAGRIVVAPFGQAQGTSWLPLIVAGLAVTAVVGWLVFGDR